MKMIMNEESYYGGKMYRDLTLLHEFDNIVLYEGCTFLNCDFGGDLPFEFSGCFLDSDSVENLFGMAAELNLDVIEKCSTDGMRSISFRVKS